MAELKVGQKWYIQLGMVAKFSPVVEAEITDVTEHTVELETVTRKPYTKDTVITTTNRHTRGSIRFI